MRTIVTLTANPSLDANTAVDHVVAERKLRCDNLDFEPGGGGINVSRALLKLGGSSIACYPSGGPTGEILGDLLDAEGVEQHRVPIEGWTRENFVVFERASFRQYRFGTPGPGLSDREWHKTIEEVEKILPKPDFLVASGSPPPGAPQDFLARVAELGRRLGCQVILDSSGDSFARALRESRVHLIKPNLREFRKLVGKDLKRESELERAALEIVEKGRSDVVVVSMGAAGVLSVSRDGAQRVRAPAVKIESKVGAGDSQVAGMVLSLARGGDLPEAVRFGVAAGAAAVMTPGTELCRKEDAVRLYEEMQVEAA